MPTPSKPQLAIYAAAAIAVVLIGARFLRSGGGAGAAAGGAPAYSTSGAGSTGGGARSGSGSGSVGGGSSAHASAGAVAPDGTEPPGGATAAGAPVVVDVKGAVRRPGVYRLAAGARALDAVRLAGGLTHRADRIGVNLAARVVDGGEVIVPERGRGGASSGAGGGAVADGASSGTGGSSGSGAPLSIDLDTATEQQLEQLDGVGPATAAKIVAYRTQHGGIASVDDLDNVPGIGPAKLAAIRAQLGR